MEKPNLEYLKSLKPQRSVEVKDKNPIEAARIYIDFCRVAVGVKHAHPEDRAAVAHNIVTVGGISSLGASVCPEIDEIENLACSLELPDPHIYIYPDNKLTPAQGWEKLERLVNQAHTKLQDGSR